MPELAEILAGHRGPGCVLAPAGFGKTHLIAEAVACGPGKQLVLTHTYAGVNALRRKMRQLRVRDSAYHIDTIASWALRLCLSYASTSGWTTERPDEAAQWTELYRACSMLLETSFMRRVILASYAGCYIDEYQDCSSGQHDLVLKLIRHLPCRVLGDPLQAIFDFDDLAPVEWARDVAANFEALGRLETPHRWVQAGHPQIGDWLRSVREKLEHGEAIDLSQQLPAGVTVRQFTGGDDLFRAQGNACRYFRCGRGETVIAIHGGNPLFKQKCHNLARNVSGLFSSIEEIEGKDLFTFIRKVTAARTDAKRLKEAIAFAAKCMTGVEANLPAATVRGEVAEIRANTRNPEAARCANAYRAAPTGNNLTNLLTAIQAAADVNVVRADLLNRAMGVLRKQAAHPQLTLAEAAEKYQGEFRHRGRPVAHRKLIGTTLLVKGLEFDHALVLDADSLSRKELYVALTRGAKSLGIISGTNVLNPQN